MNNSDNNQIRSPATRVSIDGSKIKFIRESKGLTQLYVATFLGVTPDTVSRWENKRYPTVKWENVEKLAEALEVNPSELLDSNETGHQEKDQDRKKFPPFTGLKGIQKTYIFYGVVVIFSLLFSIGIYFNINKNSAAAVSATRYLPKHVPAGQVFPVVIRVESDNAQPFSFILQEKLPDNFEILQSLPPVASQNDKNNSVKWISNSQQSPFFLAYLVRAASKFSSLSISFSGQIKADNAPQFKQDVAGESVLEISNYHWIDSNSDSVIDDEEILMVYSSADILKQLGVNMEEIKNIWSAGQYTWNPDINEYQVAE